MRERERERVNFPRLVVGTLPHGRKPEVHSQSCDTSLKNAKNADDATLNVTQTVYALYFSDARARDFALQHLKITRMCLGRRGQFRTHRITKN